VILLSITGAGFVSRLLFFFFFFFYITKKMKEGNGQGLEAHGKVKVGKKGIVANDVTIYNHPPAPPPAAHLRIPSSFCLVVSCFDGGGLGPELVFPLQKRLFCPFGEFFFFQPPNDEKLVVFWRIRLDGEIEQKLGDLLSVLCGHFGDPPCVITCLGLEQHLGVEGRFFVPSAFRNWRFNRDQFNETLGEFGRLISLDPLAVNSRHLETILHHIAGARNVVSLLVAPQHADLKVVQKFMGRCVEESLQSNMFAHRLHATLGGGSYCRVSHKGGNMLHTVGSLLGLCKSVGARLADQLACLLVRTGSVEVYLESKNPLFPCFLEAMKATGLLNRVLLVGEEVTVKFEADFRAVKPDASWDLQSGTVIGNWQPFLEEFRDNLSNNYNMWFGADVEPRKKAAFDELLQALKNEPAAKEICESEAWRRISRVEDKGEEECKRPHTEERTMVEPSASKKSKTFEMEERSVRLTLKSGQTWDILLPESPLVVPLSCSLEELKQTVSQHLGDTPSPQDIILARPIDENLMQLTGKPDLLVDGAELFVFSIKTWESDERKRHAPDEVESIKAEALEPSAKKPKEFEDGSCHICKKQIAKPGEYQVCANCRKINCCERCTNVRLGGGIPFTACVNCPSVFIHNHHPDAEVKPWLCKNCASKREEKGGGKLIIMEVLFEGLQKSIRFSESESVGKAMDRILAEFQVTGKLEEFVLVAHSETVDECKLVYLDDTEARLQNLAFSNGDTLELRTRAGGDETSQVEEEEEEEEEEVIVETRAFMEKLASTASHLRRIGQGVAGAESLLADLDAAMSKAQETRVRWVFVGDLGIGKSGLINRILTVNWDIKAETTFPLPSKLGAHSLTKHITEVSWAPTEWIVVANDVTWKFNSESELSDVLKNFPTRLNARLSAQWNDAEVEGLVPVIRVSGPFPGLINHKDVTLVDTPGFESQKTELQKRRFLECVRSASVLMVLSARLSVVSLDKLLSTGALNGQIVPSVIACAVFTEDDVGAGLIQRDTDLFRVSLKESMIKLVQPEGTVLETWRRVTALAKTAQVFYRNASTSQQVDSFVESVRKVSFNTLLTNIYECFSTLWFFLNIRASGTKGRASSKEQKQRRERLNRLLKKMHQGMEAVWGLPNQMVSRESQCRLGWYRFVSESSQSTDSILAAWQQLHPLLNELCDELVACGRDAIDAGADWAEKMFKKREGGKKKKKKRGGRQYEAIIMEEEEEVTDEESTSNAQVIPLLLRRKGKQFFDEAATVVREKCQILFSYERLLNTLRAEKSLDDELQIAACFRVIITRPCLDVLHAAVFDVVDRVQKWTLKEFDNSASSSAIGDCRAELKDILAETKGLFVNYMLREHDLVLPRTTLGNADPPADSADSICGALNSDIKKRGDYDSLQNRWHRLPKGVFSLVTPDADRSCIIDGDNHRILSLSWDKANDLNVRLLATQTGWNDIKAYANDVCSNYSFNPRAPPPDREVPKFISPIFCFSMVDDPADVGTVRCKDLFQSHGDADKATWLLVYVVYEDQLDWFRKIVNRSTFILTMPRDAILLVGQDAVKLLCEQLQFPFRWSIPAFLARTSMFYKSVMRGRVCSPASMFYHVENGQFGPLIHDTLRRIANVFAVQENSECLLRVLKMTKDDSAMALVLQFTNGAKPFRIWDVEKLIALLNVQDESVQALRNRLIEMTSSMYLIAEVQVRHGMKFLVNYLQNKDGLQRNFRIRTSRSSNTGVVLSNVIAQQPFSHFWENYTWKGEHLRRGRVTNEDDFRLRQTESLDKILNSCGGAGLRGLFNDLYMWNGEVRVQRRTSQKKKKKKTIKKK
jgi:hypothetical protein